MEELGEAGEKGVKTHVAREEWKERDPQWVHFHLSSGRRVRKSKEKEEKWERNGWRRGEEASAGEILPLDWGMMVASTFFLNGCAVFAHVKYLSSFCAYQSSSARGTKSGCIAAGRQQKTFIGSI